MMIKNLLQDAQQAAEAESAGDPHAHAQLLDAIRKLNVAVESPADAAMRLRFQPVQNVCIRVALEMGLLNAIVVKGGNATTALELSRETGCDELVISRYAEIYVRIMRVLTAIGICDEVGASQYKTNALAEGINTPGWSGGVKHFYDLLFPVGAKMVEYMHSSEFHRFPEKLHDRSPFEFTFNMPMWEYMQHEKDQRVFFDDYMASRREGLPAQWHEIFPAASQLSPELKPDQEAVLLVDVGGGGGHDVESFKQRHPDLPGRLILQDLAPALDQLKGPLDGIEKMPYDFFTPQPVKGARAYYLRNICHDWSDTRCRDFLSHTAQAMDKDYSRMLIDDFVLPETGAGLRSVSMDVLMMMFVGGIERTESQWRRLLDSAGLEIVKIWMLNSSYEAVIEAKVK